MRGILLAVLALAGVAAAAQAEDYVRLSDLVILYQPDARPYRPSGSDMDLADQGKSFDIVCTIAHSGHLTDCQAFADNIADRGFVNSAVDNLHGWVVGDTTRSGQATEGMRVRLTVRFQLQA